MSLGCFCAIQQLQDVCRHAGAMGIFCPETLSSISLADWRVSESVVKRSSFVVACLSSLTEYDSVRIVFVPRISCYSGGFLIKLILVHVPFVLLLFLFGIHYRILPELLLLYLALNELSNLTISGLPLTRPTTIAACTRASDSILDTGAL